MVVAGRLHVLLGLGEQDEVLRAVVAHQQEVALVEQLDVATGPVEHLAVERGDVAASRVVERAGRERELHVVEAVRHELSTPSGTGPLETGGQDRVDEVRAGFAQRAFERDAELVGGFGAGSVDAHPLRQRDEVDAIEAFGTFIWDIRFKDFDSEYNLARITWDEARHIACESMSRASCQERVCATKDLTNLT